MAVESRILIADEDQAFVSSTAAFLSNAGFAVDTVFSAADLRRHFAQQAYDLLIVDLNMKGNDELSLLKDLKANHPDYSIIVVTAFPSVPTAVETLRLRVLDYVVKPIDMGDFATRVRAALLKGKVLRTIRAARDAWGELEQHLQKFEQSLVQAGALAGDQEGVGLMDTLLDNLARQFRESAMGLLDAYELIQAARQQDASGPSEDDRLNDLRRFDSSVNEILALLKDAEAKGEVASLASVREKLESLLH